MAVADRYAARGLAKEEVTAVRKAVLLREADRGVEHEREEEGGRGVEGLRSGGPSL